MPPPAWQRAFCSKKLCNALLSELSHIRRHKSLTLAEKPSRQPSSKRKAALTVYVDEAWKAGAAQKLRDRLPLILAPLQSHPEVQVREALAKGKPALTWMPEHVALDKSIRVLCGATAYFTNVKVCVCSMCSTFQSEVCVRQEGSPSLSNPRISPRRTSFISTSRIRSSCLLLLPSFGALIKAASGPCLG